MATNLNLDDKLVEAARRVGKHDTKRAAVTAALREYVHRRKARKILNLFEQIEYWPDYDYKASRRKRAA
jgi:Arc/MetJ family transcription regulator